MRTTVALLTLAAAVARANYVELNKESFDGFVREKDLSLVKFYAPWCGHCNAMKPAYEAAAKTLIEDNIHLAKVNCPDERELCERYDVSSYPTLKVFRAAEATSSGADYKGKMYKGKRGEEDIVKYMKRQAMPAITHVDDSKELKDFTTKDKVVVVAFHEGEGDMLKEFEKTADTHRDDFVFGATKNKELHKEHNVDEPKIVVFRSFDEPAHYNVKEHGAYTLENIKSFITASSIPLMDDISPENYNDYVETRQPLGFLFVSDEAQREKIGPQIKEVAKKYKGKVNFVFIDSTKYGSHASNLNLKEGDWPAFAISNMEEGTKYPFEQGKEITQEAVDKLVSGMLDGSIQPSLKSQEIPTDDSAPVKTIVGKNYKDIALDTDKDVLIKFYAPWCGHCKALVEPWKTVASKVVDAGATNVVVSEFDATENDLPKDAGFSIEGFPTIKLVKAGTNEVIDYPGDRSIESLLDFLKENAHHSSQIPSGKPDPVKEKSETDPSATDVPKGGEAEAAREEL